MSVVVRVIGDDGRGGRGREPTDIRIEPAETERAIRLVATLTGTEATRLKPIVSAELPPRGERFEGVLPPVAKGPCFAIRKPAGQVIRLDAYVETGIVTLAQACALRSAIHDRANIIVAGGTGSGKTTLTNALLGEVASLNERVVLLEDTRELQCAADLNAARALYAYPRQYVDQDWRGGSMNRPATATDADELAVRLAEMKAELVPVVRVDPALLLAILDRLDRLESLVRNSGGRP